MNQKTFILIILIASACNLMAGDDKEEAKKGGRATELSALSSAVLSSALLPAIKTSKGLAPVCFGGLSPIPCAVSDASRFSPVSHDPFDPSNCRRGQ